VGPADPVAADVKRLGGLSIPSGRLHDTINYIVLFLISFYILRELEVFQASLFATGYLIGLYFLSPDLDTKSNPYRRWGPFRVIWIPYRLLFKHRGISHNPVIGPFLPLSYLGGILLAAATVASIKLPSISLTNSFFVISGLWVPSLVHFLVDRKA
jgi:uncharacterized metal-binding protein